MKLGGVKTCECQNKLFSFCDELRPHIERQVTSFREPVSVEARVAVTVWRLATNVEYRTISELFGLGRSTVAVVYM